MHEPIPIYIGYDDKEPVAYHVLAHSILKRSSVPVSITPLNRKNISKPFYRPRGEYDSTDFSNSRWIVPALQQYQGWAIFMDCDMLCLDDIAGLWEQRQDAYTVMVKLHQYEPKSDKKFLDQTQTKYRRKNWSSLMLMNCSRCRMLSPHIVNTMSPGLWFHQFDWVPDDEIGSVEGPWNLLVGYHRRPAYPGLVHFTDGGPWHGYNDVDYAEDWWVEYESMLQGSNPIDYRGTR